MMQLTADLSRRLATIALTGLFATIIVFYLVNLEPNLKRLAISQTESRASEQVIEGWLRDNGFRRSLVERYAAWLGVWPKRPNTTAGKGMPVVSMKGCGAGGLSGLSGILEGDFGCSTLFKTRTVDKLLPALRATGILMFWVLITMVPVALVIGILAGMKEGSSTDRSFSILSILTTATPEYVSGVLFTVLFATHLGWLNGSAATATSEGISVRNLTLPVITPAIYGAGYIARMTRASLVEVMSTQYIRTARLKGLSFTGIVIKHALRNALIAPFTVIMLQIPWLLTGIVIVEIMFRYQGFGYLLVSAAGNNDIDLLLACSVISTAVVLLSQFISDFGYILLNPRIRVR